VVDKALRNKLEEVIAKGRAAVARGDLPTARKFLQMAVAARPERADLRVSLAEVLERTGDKVGAAENLTRAIAADPDGEAAVRSLCRLLARGRLAPHARLTPSGLVAAMESPHGDRDLLSAAALHHFVASRRVAPIMAKARRDGYAAAASDLIEDDRGEVLDDPLLLTALRAGVVVHPELQLLLAAARRHLLLHMAPARIAERASLLAFTVALAEQCRSNEYVWPEQEDERERSVLGRLIVVDETVESGPAFGAEVLVAGLYRPLREVLAEHDASTDTFSTPRARPALLPPAVQALVERHLGEDAAIHRRAASLPRLGLRNGETTRRVAGQYEASPYPRWRSVPVHAPGGQRAHLATFFSADELGVLDRPFEVLIAGCGTGRQAVSASFDYGAPASITGIDISATSLAYASLMAEARGVANLQLAVADLTELPDSVPEFRHRFQVIECVGVLHHTADPFAAWRRLLDCLAPGGLMVIGLYSALARRDVAKLRAAPDYPGPGCDAATLRAYRARLAQLPEAAPGARLRRSVDFHSSSGFRDYLLNVQEHRLTLRQIETFLAAERLAFRGFEGVPIEALRARFPHVAWPGPLSLWAELEADMPDMFSSMYVFWCSRQR
jgi:SAM-dependent methyltransferase